MKQYHFYETLCSLTLTSGLLIGCSSSSDLKWNHEKNYRWAEIEPGYFGSTGFELLESSHTNIHFINRVTEEEIGENRHYLNGSGVAAGDIDGDGLVDLYFAGLGESNRLYKNLGGMRFKDITDQAGVAHKGYYSTGVVFADVNGDRDLDLLVTSMHRENVLYTNDGNGKFELKEDSGLGPAKGSMTMVLADIDGDLDLDLYIANYKEKTVKDLYTTEELEWDNILNEPYNEQKQAGPYTLAPPFDRHYELFLTHDNNFAGAAETGKEDELYINRGGTFEKITDTQKVFLNEHGEPYGLQPDWGLTAKFQDLNGDGLPDLYVCNDFFTKDRIWINQGGGIFKAIEWQAIRNMSFACMGVDFSDINRDGLLDIFTTEMLSPEHNRRLQQVGSNDPLPIRIGQVKSLPTYNRNSMYLKRADNTYSEISYLSGTEATGWSWDATFMDVNLDGYEDLLVSTGYLYGILDIDAQMEMIRRGRNMDEHFTEYLREAPPLDLPNRILMNNGDLTFQEKSLEWGFGETDISQGMAVADLNNDGAPDVIFNRMNREAAVYQNTTRAPRIAVRLRGRPPNTQAVGAKIELYGGPVFQQKEIAAGGDYLSGSDPMAMFAGEPENHGHRLVVTWPRKLSGQQSEIDSVQVNRIYELYEPETAFVVDEEKSNPAGNTLFEDVSGRIGHRHHEEPFNDFDLQPLLPVRLSQLGPGMAWIDIDRDGDDDLFVASGKGGTIGAFENLADGSFTSLNISPFTETAPGDQTSIIGWGTENGANFLVGSANYEQGSPRVPSVFRYRFKDLKTVETGTISNYSTTGPLAASDYDGDGDLDLFVGGRFVPAHYPRNATSRLFTNERGTLVPDQVNSRKLSESGLITGAVFTDYDLDGDQDLLLSREWDSIILMENNDGIFNDVSVRAGLSAYKGWWNGIATGDFNNDGYQDIVATNRGLNSSYQLRESKPLRMYYDDFNRDGRVDIIEAYAVQNGDYVPRKRLYEFQSLSMIAGRMESHQQFANTTLKGIFGALLPGIPYKEINTLEHMIFINTGRGFEAHPLPKQAQFSAAFYAGVADVDNDGNEDLFLSQNFFAVPGQAPRLDAGRGLWLKGDGNVGMEAVPGNLSGIKIYGEQRGAALGDFNRDGKVDLAVSQNGAETKLYINRTGERGLRIKLRGPPQNMDGIGSGIRLVYKDGDKGPGREVQSGSGYWSQNSFTQVMGMEKEPDKIVVTWFDGTIQTVNVTENLQNYTINYEDVR